MRQDHGGHRIGSSTGATGKPRQSLRSRSHRASLARDDQAASSLMEDLPPFIIVTIAVGVFLTYATKAVLAYQQGYDQIDLVDEARTVVKYVRAHPSLLTGPSAGTGEFSMDKVHALNGRAVKDPGGVLSELSVREPAKVRIIDVSPYRGGCADPCTVLAAKVVPPALESGARRAIVTTPVTLDVGPFQTRTAMLEVTLWPSP